MRRILPLVVILAFSTTASAQDQSAIQVVGWYKQYLNRAPNRDEVRAWAAKLQQGEPPLDVLAQFLAIDEYFGLANNRPNAFIAQLYAQAIGRQATGDEIRAWVAMYNRLGGNRLALTRSFAQNLLGKPGPNPGQLDPEAVRLTVFWYRHHMRRDPNQPELNAWVTRLGTGASPFDAHAEMLAGDKYFAIQNGNVDAMIAAMYRETVTRRPAPEEIAYWRSVLQPTGNRVALTRAFLRWAETPNNDGGQLNAPSAGPANGVAELMLQLASLIQQNSRDELANTPQGRRLQSRTENLVAVCEGYRQEVVAIGNARVDPWTALLNVEQSLQGVIDELGRPAGTAPRTATLVRQMTQLAPVWRETLGTAVRPPMRLAPLRPFN